MSVSDISGITDIIVVVTGLGSTSEKLSQTE